MRREKTKGKFTSPPQQRTLILGDAGNNCPENLDVEPGKRTEKQLRLTRASDSKLYIKRDKEGHKRLFRSKDQRGLVFMELSTSLGKKATSSPKRQTRIQAKNKALKGARARLYIICRCVVMLLCWKERKDE
ncbi:hypothetical protein NC651_000946 [Populus alba x Populus x berolinensis]|nr:hypothetical protein NC651_000946 [Populus alba x Populus x berolinensis]